MWGEQWNGVLSGFIFNSLLSLFAFKRSRLSYYTLLSVILVISIVLLRITRVRAKSRLRLDVVLWFCLYSSIIRHFYEMSYLSCLAVISVGLWGLVFLRLAHILYGHKPLGTNHDSHDQPITINLRNPSTPTMPLPSSISSAKTISWSIWQLWSRWVSLTSRETSLMTSNSLGQRIRCT